ncbi:MAG: substrate-binding domain-containing protein [Hydrotalea flava]|uniref:LacI family DNA-binding transcriptional regulator n=1 Tax=Hydrotalea lipotrueae TaxID=2803817 RepID=UPI0016BA0B06|nr:LacI family DNA-binding transcriptional regulator [Hydrotalea lipotrueae]MBY0348787.1 LacI family transcriptional regulator [Hydrotalea flava]NIM35572.1 substrate-binding domain-containing protein [Hydrotalea flava]NIM38429.1 substrate-binding domain-containing protein [Hydrotalea flava]NIN03599.1 substrate-binding domain-containing protein [Hydrotalea flava]NIN15286.1 substrate-binding domain-containing protein [Hydrotalea flava]
MTNTTLKKISEVLGVSISTVSRALKNHPDISEKTKAKVVELAQTLDYEPNANAIHLRTNNSNLFGLLVPTISNYFYDSFIAAIEEDSRQQGYSLIILQSGDDPSVEATNLKICRQNRVSGVFACITPYTKDMQPFQKMYDMGIPVVFFDKVPDYANCNRVCVADTAAAALAANALNNAAAKKVLAIFGNPAMSITKKRLNAFNGALQPQTDVTVVHALDRNEATKLTAQHLTKQHRPDAVFCMSDEILTGTMKAIQNSALKIPQQIKVIAISNGFFPYLYHPTITYVETSGYRLGKLAFSKMMTCLSGDTNTAELSLPCALVQGGSM